MQEGPVVQTPTRNGWLIVFGLLLALASGIIGFLAETVFCAVPLLAGLACVALGSSRKMGADWDRTANIGLGLLFGSIVVAIVLIWLSQLRWP